MAGVGSESSNALGNYLRARRNLILPESVGPRGSTRRRVPGLTREEVAVAAGVSVEYYIRLEQGKDRRPSAQVISALSSALKLDGPASAFLADLAQERVVVEDATKSDTVPDGILALLSHWHATPAFVVGRFGQVLAASATIAELTPACQPGGNMFREIFLSPESKQRYVNWHDFTTVLVAGLRAAVGRDVDSPELVSLVQELESGSPRFGELWRRHDASPASGGLTVIRHPREGQIRLQVETLTIAGTDLSLVVYHAAAGSDDEAAILRLAT